MSKQDRLLIDLCIKNREYDTLKRFKNREYSVKQIGKIISKLLESK